jgi:hypothetical protein
MATATGIGCFLFLYRGDEDEFDAETHLDTIVAVLNKVDNVSNVIAKGYHEIFDMLTDPTRQECEDAMLPLYSDLEIRFDIFLPKRVQDQLLDRPSHCQSEHFNIRIYKISIFQLLLYPMNLPMG